MYKCMYEVYSTPLVLGTSLPPVLEIASRMAKAKALKADSDLRKHGEKCISHVRSADSLTGDDRSRPSTHPRAT